MAGGAQLPGPVIRGQQTTIRLLTNPELASSPLLRGVYEVINDAFSHCHPPYINASFKRLFTPEQILTELESDSFTFVVTVPREPRSPRDGPDDDVQAIACGSAFTKVNRDPGERPEEVKKTTVKRSAAASETIPGVLDWELKHLCVRPEYMRQGIAGKLLGMIEDEIRARTSTYIVSESQNSAVGQIRIMITTLKEMNGYWYERRGYKTVETADYPAGTLDGTEPFAIWHMDRVIDVIR